MGKQGRGRKGGEMEVAWQERIRNLEPERWVVSVGTNYRSLLALLFLLLSNCT